MPITMDMNKFQSQPIKPSLVQSRQASNAGTDPAQQEMTRQLAQLPGYQQYIDLLLNGSTMTERSRAYKALMTDAAAAGIQIPEDMKMDMYGAVRDKTWAERHPKLSYGLMIAGATGGVVGGAALAGAMAGGAGATPAVTGAAGGSVGAGGTAGGASSLGAAGVGIGETSAMTGGLVGPVGSTLASSTAGVPLAAAGPVAGGASSGAVAAGLGGAGSSSVLGMSPSTYELIYGAAGKGLEAYGNSKQASEQRKAELLRAQMGVAADENARDPFRQQMAQIRNLGQMDMMQSMKAPAPAGPSGPYARPAGEGVQPGSYAPSAEMLQWIAQMKRNVAGGQNTAPTMTNPANYGKTSVMNLSSPQPPAPTMPGAPPTTAQSGGMTLEQMLAFAKKQQEEQAAPQSRWQGLA
jgi:hypothetical protein